VVKAPARDPSDFGIAQRAEPALFMPEKAERASTPKRVLHMSFFAFFEVDFIGRVVGVRVSFDFNVSLDGCATGGPQPNLNGLALVITLFTEEGPVATTTRRKVLLLAPACVLVRVSSSCPSSLGPLHIVVVDTPSPRGSDVTLTGMGTLSEGFERFVAAPLLSRRLRPMGRTV